MCCIEQLYAFQTRVDTRTCVPAFFFFFFCFAVCNYKFSNLAHTYWHVQSRFLHVALVLVVVLLLGALVLVVLVFVLVLMVVLGWLVLVLLVPVLLVVLLLLAMVLVVVLVVRAGGGGGGGGGAGPRAGAAGAGGGWWWLCWWDEFRYLVRTSFAYLVRTRHNCNKVRVLFYFIGLRDKYWVLLLSVPRVHCKVLQTSETEHCFFLLITMQIGLIEWKFADFWV